MAERRIPISTPVGDFTVWTSTHGSNPRMRLLLLHCPDGSHIAMWDDAEVYAQGVLAFMREVDAAA